MTVHASQLDEGNKMIRTLKAAFGLGLLAALSMAAMSVMSASATSNGHFVSDSPSGLTTLDITEATGSGHEVKLTGWGSTVQCHTVKYTKPTLPAGTTETPTVAGETVTAIGVTADYSGCTKGEETVSVTMNGCHYEFTPGGTGTVHFKCAPGVFAEVHTGAGTMRFTSQTVEGITYTNITAHNKHAITAHIAVHNIKGECHGFCQFLGTTRHDISMTGSVTIEGTDKLAPGTYVNITHTAP